MHFASSFTQQQHFEGLKMGFKIHVFEKQYPNDVNLCTVYSYAFVRRHIVFLYKVTSPTTGLACIIQLIYSFDNIVLCMRNFKTMRRKKFSFLIQSLPCKRMLRLDGYTTWHFIMDAFVYHCLNCMFSSTVNLNCIEPAEQVRPWERARERVSGIDRACVGRRVCVSVSRGVSGQLLCVQ